MLQNLNNSNKLTLFEIVVFLCFEFHQLKNQCSEKTPNLAKCTASI